MCEKIIKIELLRGAKLPTKATEQSAGYDIFNICGFTLKPGEQISVPSGIQMELPPGTYAELRARSSISRVMVRVEAGIIDSDYRGEIMILLYNYGKETFTGVYDRRYVQMIIHPFCRYNLIEGKICDEKNHGGFGSTGQ